MCASISLVQSMHNQKFVMQNLKKYMYRLSYLLIFYHVMLNVCSINGVMAQYPDDAKMLVTNKDEVSLILKVFCLRLLHAIFSHKTEFQSSCVGRRWQR
jgi:hypothetical protein